MSLINDMLRDLAKRQQGSDIALNDSAQLLADSGLARRQRSIWLPSIMIFVVVLILFIVGQQVFWKKAAQSPVHSTETLSELPNTRLEQVLVTDPTFSMQEKIVEAEKVADTTTAEKVVVFDVQSETDPSTATETDNETGSQEKIIDAWLQLANRSLAEDQLTAPIEDSAYYYYQQVLALVPQHPQAVNGLNNIVERYVALIQVALQQNEYPRAHTLMRRAKMVIADYPALVELETQLVGQSHAPVPDVISSREVSTQDELVPATSLDESVETYSLPAQAPGFNHMEVTPNRAWQDQQAAAQASELIQRGQVQSARLQLEGFLQKHGDASLSSQLLFSIYVEQNDSSAAEKLLASTNAEIWPANDRVRLQAQWLVAKGDSPAALTVLEKNLDKAEKDERYRALLASLYHSNGNYHQAVASYRRLLSTFGEKSAYWLGLALALDGLQQSASALESYRRAQSFQNLQDEVNTYIEQRVAALTR